MIIKTPYLRYESSSLAGDLYFCRSIKKVFPYLANKKTYTMSVSDEPLPGEYIQVFLRYSNNQLRLHYLKNGRTSRPNLHVDTIRWIQSTRLNTLIPISTLSRKAKAFFVSINEVPNV